MLVSLVVQADISKQLKGALAHLICGLTLDTQRPLHDVVEHGHLREEVELLEDHPAVCAQASDLLTTMTRGQPRRDGDAGHLDRALIGVLQEVDAPQEGALARSRSAEDHDNFAGIDIHVDVLEHLEVAEGLVEPADADHG